MGKGGEEKGGGKARHTAVFGLDGEQREASASPILLLRLRVPHLGSLVKASPWATVLFSPLTFQSYSKFTSPVCPQTTCLNT